MSHTLSGHFEGRKYTIKYDTINMDLDGFGWGDEA